MKVYEIDHKKMQQQIRNMEEPIEAFTGYLSLKIYRFRREDLLAYGLAGDDIKEMLERGSLLEVEVDWREANRIRCYHRYHADAGYRANVLMGLAKGRASVSSERRRELAKEAREYRDRRIRERRELLMNEVIIPRFGEKNGNTRLPPEKVSAALVVNALRKYPDILSRYPKEVYEMVRRDIHVLGLMTGNKSECARMMCSVLWKAYRNDEAFREEMQKKHLKGSAKGHRAVKKRIDKRRKALRRFIKREIGDLSHVSSNSLASYIERKHPDFAEKYYGGCSLYYTVKRDLHYLRNESD